MIYFIDLDGVIIDSAKECYLVSKFVYYKNKKFNYDEDKYSKLFYKYRGLVGPAGGFELLHSLIEKKFKDNRTNIKENFKFSKNKENSSFEKNFFNYRQELINHDYDNWIKLNTLTHFGKTIVNRNDLNINIITTKNKEATYSILKHHDIFVNRIFSNEDIKEHSSKGMLIINETSTDELSKIVFIDDLVDHLEIARDLGIKSFFADWGYGENTNFEIFNKNLLIKNI